MLVSHNISLNNSRVCTQSIISVQFSALPPVRVVFSVTMEGSARKVITVQSALTVKNHLEVPMEVRLDSPSAPDSKHTPFCL